MPSFSRVARLGVGGCMYGSCFLEASHRQTAGAAAEASCRRRSRCRSHCRCRRRSRRCDSNCAFHTFHRNWTASTARQPPKRPAKLSKYVSGQTILLSQGGITLEEGRAYSNSWPPLLLSLWQDLLKIYSEKATKIWRNHFLISEVT